MAGATRIVAPPPLRTEVIRDATRTHHRAQQLAGHFLRPSINPYRGCEHGCIYCFARPTHAYLGMSPGADFESRLFAKPNAAELLAKELSAPGYVPKVIAIGTNTDPYQPIEKKMRIMRSILEVLRDFRHPVGIVTKSPLMLRDIDILSDMAREGLAKVALSVTTLDRKLARTMEPRAGTPQRRLQAIRALERSRYSDRRDVRAGHSGPQRRRDGERCSSAAADCGATHRRLCASAPAARDQGSVPRMAGGERADRAKHVMSLIRQMRGGKDYDAQWSTRMKGTGPYAEMIAKRFHMAVKRLGLNKESRPLSVTRFRKPPRTGDQLSLFGGEAA